MIQTRVLASKQIGSRGMIPRRTSPLTEERFDNLLGAGAAQEQAYGHPRGEEHSQDRRS